MPTYHVSFSIDGWEPSDLPVISEFAQGAHMTKRLSGDLVGESVGLFINAGQAEGQRTYMVCERLSGTATDGTPSSIVLEHGGVENDESACFGRIVPATGTGIFEGARGIVSFENDDSGEYMQLTVTDPA